MKVSRDDAARAYITAALKDIAAKLFKDPTVKLTLVVNFPKAPDSALVVTNDELSAVKKTVERQMVGQIITVQ
jgi:hypothetical protein